MGGSGVCQEAAQLRRSWGSSTGDDRSLSRAWRGSTATLGPRCLRASPDAHQVKRAGSFRDMSDIWNSPQNELPAKQPRLATRFIISDPHVDTYGTCCGGYGIDIRHSPSRTRVAPRLDVLKQRNQSFAVHQFQVAGSGEPACFLSECTGGDYVSPVGILGCDDTAQLPDHVHTDIPRLPVFALN
jgi:hypothetical protein